MITTQICKFIGMKQSEYKKERQIDMEINKETLNKIKALDDEQLKAAIGDIADALGATPQQKRRAQNNSKLIKKKILTSNENELRRQINKITPEQQNEIARKLKF